MLVEGLADTIIVTVPPVLPSTIAADHPLHGLCNVRLTKVRFVAVGATTDKGMLFVQIEHGGIETFVRDDGSSVKFEHGQLTVDYCYEIADTTFQGPGTIDGDIGEKSEGQFAKVGPFTNWKIRVSPDHNTGLSLANVKEAYLEFEGQFEAFSI